MLRTTEQKKKYIQATRAQNYQASLKLEGITTTAQTTQQSKAEILQKYKKYSQPETQSGACMDKYGEMGDSLYCYPGTNILKNKLNIQIISVLKLKQHYNERET